MLRCSEVARLCAGDELRRSSLLTRAAVRLHLLLCSRCRRYVRELEAIGAAMRGLWREAADPEGRREAILRRVLTDPEDPTA